MNLSKLNFAKTLGAAALVSLSSVIPTMSQAETLRFLYPWDASTNSINYIARAFADKVSEETDGRFDFTFSGPEVVPPGQQFEPISSGIFDLGMNAPSYISGTTGVPFAFFALPPDAELWRERGYWDAADEEFQRFNQKLLAFVSETDQENAFHIVLSEPLGDGETPLAGKKIRGNAFYAPMVEPLGGSLVNLPGGEIYPSLERGVVDGAGWSVNGTASLKLQEVAGYMMRPTFGTLPTYITMNLDKWNSLSAEDGEMMLRLGREVEQEAASYSSVDTQEALDMMMAGGMEETVLAPELAEELLAGAKEALWDIARGSNPQTTERVDALYELAVEGGDAGM
ncbi:MAG: TRAP transporter substrate-binding protein DctP [Pseudomonadota bacterium]